MTFPTLLLAVSIGASAPAHAATESASMLWAAYEAILGAERAANVVHAYGTVVSSANEAMQIEIAVAESAATGMDVGAIRTALMYRLASMGALMGALDLTSGYDARREAEREGAFGGGYYDGGAWDDGFPTPGDGHGGDEDDWEVESECVPTEEEGEVPCDDSGVGLVIEWHDASGAHCTVLGLDEEMAWDTRCADAVGMPDSYVSW